MTAQTVLITGSGSGFGLLTANTLSKAGHTVYGGLLHTQHDYPGRESNIRNVILDITDDASIAAAVKKIVSEAGHIDCLIHNAGHMCVGPAEAFSAEQYHQYFEINCVGAHRLNQAVLPIMRKAGKGHVVWISSSSCRGGSGPLLGPYFAAKAAMHSLALTLSTEITCWGIETSIIVPGIFTSGTNHFATAGRPASTTVEAEYLQGPLEGVNETMMDNVNKTFPKDASPQLVADAVLEAVGAPRGSKPFRVPVDPYQDGSDEVMTLSDQKHEEFLRRGGIFDVCTVLPN